MKPAGLLRPTPNCRNVACMLWAGMMMPNADQALGQAFPIKPMRIVTAAAGGGPDFAARVIAQGLSSSLGQQVIVDNRGGSVVIMAEIVAKAQADGHTVLLSAGTFWLKPFLQSKVPYDPLRDFLPVTLATTTPTLLVVHPGVAVTSVKELVALAKAKPGGVTYASGPAGSTSHLAAELFNAMGGVTMLRIPYKGTGPALSDLMGGQVQSMFSNAASVTPHVKSGRLRALAITSRLPSALYPELPTVADTGLPGYEAVAIFGVFAPAQTPAALVRRLNQEIVRVLKQADVKEKFHRAGVETIGSSPEELSATVKSEMTRLGKVIKDAGIRDE